MQDQTNTFFTKEVYETEIGLDINEDVLRRIHSDDVLPTDKLPIEFVFITDMWDKAKLLKHSLSSLYPDYTDIDVEETEDYWEVHGVTNEIEMNIIEVNNWNQLMWDLGYKFDCQLDGWQVGSELGECCNGTGPL